MKTGSYRLKEIEAPSGYILSETEIPFTISTFLSEDKEADSILKVVNKKKIAVHFFQNKRNEKYTFRRCWYGIRKLCNLVVYQKEQE